MSAEFNIPTELGPAVRALAAGQVVFGRYELRRKLGEGGFGAVWLVHDSVLREEVAFKFVLQAVAASPEAIDALKAETTRSRRLTHPNIVRIHDFVSEAEGDGLAGISMEYVDGESLAQRRLREPGKCFDVEQIAPWIDQLCQALTYAHAPKRRVIHRDLKPPNLLVTADGELKVADFGIACSLINSVTQISGRLSSGTPPFMSPQQLNGDWPSETDDVYSVGASIYMLLTGTPPFHQGDIVHQVMNKVPSPMRERRAQLEITERAAIPAVWEETVAACLAKDAAQRPPDAEAVAQRLGLRSGRAMAAPVPQPICVGEDRLDGLKTIPGPSTSSEASPPSPRDRPVTPHPSRKSKPRVWVAAALLIVLLLGGAFLSFRTSLPPSSSVPASPAAPVSTAGPDTSSGVTQPEAVRLLFPKNPYFVSYDRASEWGALLAKAWGYLDENGREVIPARWLAAQTFSEGLAGVFPLEQSDFGFVDIHGQAVITAHLEWLANGSFHEGRARVRHPTVSSVGFIDPQGKLIIPFHWDAADEIAEGTALVETKGKYGYLDLAGAVITPPKWDAATRFSEGLAGVQTGGQWGYIDREGKMAIPAQWKSAFPFSEGTAAVSREGKFGFIDREGVVVVTPQWDQARPFHEGLAVVKKDGLCSFIDPQGLVISPVEWDEADSFSESRALVKKDGKAGFIDPLGKVVIPPQFDTATSFANGLAIVKSAGGKWGCIDREGQTVIPFEWIYIAIQKSPDGHVFIQLARIEGPAPSPTETNLPAEVRWVDATGRLLWQSPH